jgi:hypothetical protein
MIESTFSIPPKLGLTDVVKDRIDGTTDSEPPKGIPPVPVPPPDAVVVVVPADVVVAPGAAAALGAEGLLNITCPGAAIPPPLLPPPIEASGTPPAVTDDPPPRTPAAAVVVVAAAPPPPPPTAAPAAPLPLPPPAMDMVATADINAASPPWESTMVVIHEFSGSGGNRTRVIIPGTTSEKCLETNVEINDDFPTPSVFFLN